MYKEDPVNTLRNVLLFLLTAILQVQIQSIHVFILN